MKRKPVSKRKYKLGNKLNWDGTDGDRSDMCKCTEPCIVMITNSTDGNYFDWTITPEGESGHWHVMESALSPIKTKKE